jgi:hypothetical protein
VNRLWSNHDAIISFYSRKKERQQKQGKAETKNKRKKQTNKKREKMTRQDIRNPKAPS